MKSLLKTSIATLSLTGALSLGAAEVISINFASYRGGTTVDNTSVPADNQMYGLVGVPGTAWKNLNVFPGPEDDDQERKGGTATGVVVYDSVTASQLPDNDVAITWTSADKWSWNYYADAQRQMRGYIDDLNGRVSVTLDNIPDDFEYCDIIVYCNCNNGNCSYAPISFDGGTTWWTWDAAQNAARIAVNAADSWGVTATVNNKLGSDIIRVNGIKSNNGRITIQTQARVDANGNVAQGGGVTRGTIAAIQIVKGEPPAPLPLDAVFSYGPYQDGLYQVISPLSTWFKVWDGTFGNTRMIGSEGTDVFVVSNGNVPYHGIYETTGDSLPEVTLATILNVENVDSADKYRVVYQFGGLRDNNVNGVAVEANAMLLYVNNGDLYLAAAGRKGYGEWYVSPEQLAAAGRAYCKFENIGPGFHLVTATYSYETQTLTLSVDGVAAQSFAGVVPLLEVSAENANNKISFQLGDTSGGGGKPVAVGENIAFNRVLGWERVLTEAEQRELLNMYSDAIAAPIKPSYQSSFNLAGGTIYVSDMNDTHQLELDQGTMNIPAGVEVTVPSVNLGINGNNDYTLNLAGELNVTAVTTQYDLQKMADQQNVKGVLFGNGTNVQQGNGTVNITGTLSAPDAWLETNTSRNNQTININGGTLSVYGIYGRNLNNNNSYSTMTLSNGGLLEAARFYASGAVALNLGEGTLKVLPIKDGNVQQGNGDGLVFRLNNNNGMAVQFTDAAKGTTLDPNGRLISFAGAVTGGGKIIVNDTSEEKNGLVSFADATALTVGDIEVLSGTINLGRFRPKNVTFAEGTKLVLSESPADGLGRIGLAFAADSAIPEVSIVLDGTTYTTAPGGGLTVVEENGKKYILYPDGMMPKLDGEACWSDWEFENYTVTDSGRAKKDLYIDDQSRAAQMGLNRDNEPDEFLAASFTEDGNKIFAAAMPYRQGDDIYYPEEWSAATFATVPKIENQVLVCFGFRTAGSICLIAGDTTKNEVKLVKTMGNDHYEPLSTMTVPNAYDTPHLYAFTKTANQVKVYLDGVLCQVRNEPVTVSRGVQLGAPCGNNGNGLTKFAFSNDPANPQYWDGEIIKSAYVDMLRLYDEVLPETSIQQLAQQFKYESPSGVYTRTVAADGNWTSEDAWLVGTDPANAPAENSPVAITADADATLTVDSAVTLESLEINGVAALTLALAEGASLRNIGPAVISTNATLDYRVDITGGPLALDAAATLTFDFSGYEIAIDAPDGTIPLTGISTGDEKIAVIPPADAKGRTFTPVFDAVVQKWSVEYKRPNFNIVWTPEMGTTLTAETGWKADLGDGTTTDVVLMAGDALVFGDVVDVAGNPIEAVTITANGLTAPKIVFNAKTTAYTIEGALAAAEIEVTADASVTIPATVTANNTKLSVTGSGEAAFTALNGTLGEVNLTAPAVTLGSGDTLAIANAFAASADTKLTIAGTGLINYTAGSNTFASSLEVTSGTFRVDGGMQNIKATADNPLLVTGTGTIYFVQDNYLEPKRIPNGGYIVVDGEGAKAIAEGNCPFPRDSEANSARIICRNGGTFQTNGVLNKNNYEIRVWDLSLEDGVLYFAGGGRQYHDHGLVIENHVLHAKGNSAVKMDDGSWNVLTSTADSGDGLEIDVAEGGLLDFQVLTKLDLVKTGKGAIVLNGAGGARSGNVEIREGSVIANAQLAKQKTVTFAEGASLDISGYDYVDNVFDIGASKLAAVNGVITLKVNEAALTKGAKLLSWKTIPDVKFVVSPSCKLLKEEDGLYFQPGGTVIIIR